MPVIAGPKIHVSSRHCRILQKNARENLPPGHSPKTRLFAVDYLKKMRLNSSFHFFAS